MVNLPSESAPVPEDVETRQRASSSTGTIWVCEESGCANKLAILNVDSVQRPDIAHNCNIVKYQPIVFKQTHYDKLCHTMFSLWSVMLNYVYYVLRVHISNCEYTICHVSICIEVRTCIILKHHKFMCFCYRTTNEQILSLKLLHHIYIYIFFLYIIMILNHEEKSILYCTLMLV